MSVRPPEAGDRDDDLVDARLRTALHHAPDGSAAPPDALRRAVLQAARASLPPKPTLWQRLFGSGPGIPRAWAAAAGIGAVGLALNLAWHMSTEGPPAEFGPVASKSVPAPAPATVTEESRIEPADAMPAAPAPAAAPKQDVARRDAASPPVLQQQPLREPVVVATAPPTAPPPAAAPAPAAAPQLAGEVEGEAKKKTFGKEERALSDRVAEAATANADKALVERRQALAPPPPPITPTTSTPPAMAPADSARNEGLAAAVKPAAPAPVESAARARSSAPAGVAPAAVLAQPSRWPEPLARMQAALSRSDDWPSGWVQQGGAEIALPRRSWWLAMLEGTTGRWQEVREPVPTSLESDPTWHVSGEHGVRFKLTVADGQAWLQSDGAVWRAPWSTLPGPSPR